MNQEIDNLIKKKKEVVMMLELFFDKNSQIKNEI